MSKAPLRRQLVLSTELSMKLLIDCGHDITTYYEGETDVGIELLRQWHSRANGDQVIAILRKLTKKTNALTISGYEVKENGGAGFFFDFSTDNYRTHSMRLYLDTDGSFNS